LKNAVTLLARLHREGLKVAPDPFEPDRLLVGPRARLTEDLAMLIVANKPALLDLVRGKPTKSELDLLVAILGAFDADELKVVPTGPRTIGAYSRCPRHPATGTFVRYGDVPACRKCELSVPPDLTPLTPRLSEWFIRLCKSRGLSAMALPKPTRAPMPLDEQIRACLSNGPKSTRQVALELGAPLADIVHVLGDRAVLEPDTVPRPMHFPERDEHEGEGER
jgi:hypothetical protein